MNKIFKKKLKLTNLISGLKVFTPCDINIKVPWEDFCWDLVPYK